MRQKTEAAQAAKIIRNELKKHGVHGHVKSSNYSMGSSVKVKLIDPMPATLEKVKSFCFKFQYGHFDGMTDSYEHSNNREDIPQAKYVIVHAEYSTHLQLEVWDWLKANFSGFEAAPDSVFDAHNFYHEGMRESGARILYKYIHSDEFWKTKKPRIAA